MRKILPLVSVILLLAFTLVFGGCSVAQRPQPQPPAQDQQQGQAQPQAQHKIEVDAFYVDDSGAKNSYDSLVKYHQHIDTLGPLWYSVEPNGHVRDKTNKEALAFAKSKNIKVIPLVNLVKSQDQILLDPASRDRSINEIVDIVKKYDLDGVNIDFEFIPTPERPKDYVKDKDKLSEYMRLLSEKLKPMKKTVMVSVIPHQGVSQNVGGIYDYSALAKVVDAATLMTYDRHQAGSQPGPVAPLQWVEDNIKNALQEGFKPEQICLGVASYGYDWPMEPGGFSRPTDEISKHAKEKGIDVKWDEKTKTPYYTYKAPNGQTRQIWFESAQTVDDKIRLAKQYKLHSICIWRLGFETPSFWQSVSNSIGK